LETFKKPEQVRPSLEIDLWNFRLLGIGTTAVYPRERGGLQPVHCKVVRYINNLDSIVVGDKLHYFGYQ